MDQSYRCESCDAPLTGQAVSGMCANCLLKLALEPPAEAMPMADEPGKEITVETAAPREAVASRIGRYKLLQEIGEGGFGIVYLADQLEPVKRRVALKVLKPGMDTREVIARFEAERQSLALMDHPNIARIFDGGTTESGRPYFVMELVKGIPLTKYCDDRHLNTRQRLDLFLDVLAAVQHAHQKGIIHRDLKPANILVSPHDGRPVIKVIDFGIAKAISLELTDKTLFTAHGRMIGTPQYMSPEQAEINALDVDTRSDLYSLGVILYELLTGRTPLDPKILRAAAYAEIQRLIREVYPPKPSTRISTLGASLPDIARRHGTEPLKLGRQLSGDLDWIVMKALEKDRNRRYETANGFATDLRRHLENQPVTARPPGTAYLLSRFVRRHKFGFAAAAAVSVALLAGVATTTWALVREAAARKTAESETAKANAANKANKQNLHLASKADFASALKALEEDGAAALNNQHAIGFAGKSRWHEGVALLTRSLERNPDHAAAALRLYETLRSRQAGKRDWPLLTIKHGWNAAFSPDGSRIATAGPDWTARVWDAQTGDAIGVPLDHEGTVYGANFSPDGTRIVTASLDHTAQMWDVETGQRIGETMHHAGYVYNASFSPDGSRIVTCGEGDTAHVWDARTGQALGEPLRHESRVHSANFSPDGSKVVTASEDRNARVWDAATGRPLAGPLRHEGSVRWASFSPDGTRIVTACQDRAARVWDVVTGQLLGEPMPHEGPVLRAHFSPDGTRVVTSSEDKTVRVWDAATGQPVTRYSDPVIGVVIGEPMRHRSAPRAVGFSPDGRRIITAAWETAQVWDAVTGQSVGWWMPHAGMGTVHYAGFSPDGTRIVTASGGTVQVWDAATTQALEEPVRAAPMLTSASFSPDGARIVIVGDSARVWDTATKQEIGSPLRPDPGEGTTGATFSPDGSRLVIATFDTARVWDVATSQAIGDLMRHKDQVSVSSVAFSPDGRKIVSAGYDRTARIWDAATGRPLVGPLRHEGEEGILVSAAFCPLGTRIVTVGASARVWDVATGQPVGQPIRGSGSASFSPDGSMLVTTSIEGPALVWNAATGQSIGKPLAQNSRVNSARFSPDGGRILTVSEDGTAMVWEVLSGRAMLGPLRHQREVISADFSPDGTRIVTVCSQTARIWDSTTGRALGESMPHRHIHSAQFSPDGTGLLTIGEDHAAIWSILTKAESAGVAEITLEILTWAQHVAGLRFSEDGELRLISAEERIAAISNASLPPGPWADLATWINTPTTRRTIDPRSKSTLRQTAERERDFDGNGNVDSLESALRYDPTVPLARLFLAAALEKAEVRKPAKVRDPSLPQRASFLRRYDLDALAKETGRIKNDSLAALWVRAANQLAEFTADTKVGVGPKPTTAREEAEKAARKALELLPGLPAAEAVLKKVQALDGTNK